MLSDICGFEIKITNNKETYLSHSDASLNYSNESLKEKEVHITPSFFLFQDSLSKVEPSLSKNENRFELLFKNSDSFDPFAAAFFLLTRYEEYFPFTPDRHGNYPAKDSFSYRFGVLDRPLIDEWSLDLKKEIMQLSPGTTTSEKKFTAIISIDIDQAFAFKHRGFFRNTLSFFQNVIRFRKKLLGSQIKTILFNQPDPFDTFEYLEQMRSSSQVPFIYFINVGNYSKFDKNISVTNPALKKIIDRLKINSPIGIHPSYYSNEKPEKFSEEKRSLECLTGETIFKSRQHFLKLKFPDTYHHLLDAGIKEDYSMGYASQPGFRAGTCTPFYWFDLEKNQVTSLKIFPITFMEGTFKNYMGMNPDEATAKMTEYINKVRSLNGYFLCIWHNQTVNNNLYWEEWKDVFEETIKILTAHS